MSRKKLTTSVRFALSKFMTNYEANSSDATNHSSETWILAASEVEIAKSVNSFWPVENGWKEGKKEDSTDEIFTGFCLGRGFKLSDCQALPEIYTNNHWTALEMSSPYGEVDFGSYGGLLSPLGTFSFLNTMRKPVNSKSANESLGFAAEVQRMPTSHGNFSLASRQVMASF